jgi:uracil phosphoribosyltransferase
MKSPVIEGRKTVFVVAMRAGAGFLDGMLEVVPGLRVGHVGLYRDPKTLGADEYYIKMPGEMHEREVILPDPLLATGHSAVAAVGRLKETQPRSIRFVSPVLASKGTDNLQRHYSEVPIVTAAIDCGLNDHGYIVPAVGDAADRTYGTKQRPNPLQQGTGIPTPSDVSGTTRSPRSSRLDRLHGQSSYGGEDEANYAQGGALAAHGDGRRPGRMRVAADRRAQSGVGC